MNADIIDIQPPPGRFDDEELTPHDQRLPIPPPHDLDAEAAVLSTCILSESTSSVADIIKPAHFYSEVNRLLYTAIRALESDGKPLDILTISGYLRDHDLTQRTGGAPYLSQIIDGTPSIAHVAAHAQIIVDKYRLRQTITVAHQIAAQGYDVPASDVRSYLTHAAKSIVETTEIKGPDDVAWFDGAEVFEPQPDIPWIVPGLYLAPGRPHLLIGYGYSGKTVAAMSLALSVASGRKVWGEYYVKSPGLVGHLDYEQGTAATKRRYVRLARAMGVDPSEIAQTLRVACLPRLRLSDDGAEDWLLRATEGMTLCIVDSLRATVLGIDENTSEIREHIDKLLRVTERTGCAFLVIHHAKKTSKDGGDSREQGRGSSAIFDAAGTVLTLTGTTPPNDGAEIVTKVAMSKTAAEASGAGLAPFALGISDVCSDDGGDDKWGLRVRHMTAQQADPPSTPQSRQAAMQHAIIAAVRQHPGMSGRAVLAAVEGKREHRWAALDELVRTGRLDETDGPRRSKNYSVPGSTDEGNADED